MVRPNFEGNSLWFHPVAVGTVCNDHSWDTANELFGLLLYGDGLLDFIVITLGIKQTT